MGTENMGADFYQQRCSELESLLKERERDVEFFKNIAEETELKHFELKNEYNEAVSLRDRIIARREREIREERRRNEQLRNISDKFQNQAMTDYLTGIYNRRYFFEILVNEIERSKRFKSTFSVLLFDIDNFKRINDTYGHLTGDEVLKHCCKLVNENTRKSDIMGRFGGEEFILILHETLPENARILADKLRTVIEENPLMIDDQVFPVTVSFGGTIYTENDVLNNLLERADNALYIAKENGRNRVEMVL